MSRRANCWDVAPMASSFASLKMEPIHGEDYATRAAIFKSIEVFYDGGRRHSSLNYRSPCEFETTG